MLPTQTMHSWGVKSLKGVCPFATIPKNLKVYAKCLQRHCHPTPSETTVRTPHFHWQTPPWVPPRHAPWRLEHMKFDHAEAFLSKKRRPRWQSFKSCFGSKEMFQQNDDQINKHWYQTMDLWNPFSGKKILFAKILIKCHFGVIYNWNLSIMVFFLQTDATGLSVYQFQVGRLSTVEPFGGVPACTGGRNLKNLQKERRLVRFAPPINPRVQTWVFARSMITGKFVQVHAALASFLGLVSSLGKHISHDKSRYQHKWLVRDRIMYTPQETPLGFQKKKKQRRAYYLDDHPEQLL